jgi:hypothetical protein
MDQSRNSLMVRVMHWSLFGVPLLLTATNRILRGVLVGNFWATGEGVAGPAVALCNIIVVPLWAVLWWAESESYITLWRTPCCTCEKKRVPPTYPRLECDWNQLHRYAAYPLPLNKPSIKGMVLLKLCTYL